MYLCGIISTGVLGFDSFYPYMMQVTVVLPV